MSEPGAVAPVPLAPESADLIREAVVALGVDTAILVRVCGRILDRLDNREHQQDGPQ